MKTNFIDNVIASEKAPICISLNVRLEDVPDFIKRHAFVEEVSPFKGAADAVLGYTKKIVDVIAPLVSTVSLNKAYYDVFGVDGYQAYINIIDYVHSKGLFFIADDNVGGGKELCDVMSRSYLGEMEMSGSGEGQEFVVPLYDVDAVTLNPYFGGKTIKPFLKEAGDYSKGVFVTVNSKDSLVGDVQKLDIEGGLVVSDIVAHYVESFGDDYLLESGYSLLGAIFSPNSEFESKKMRETMTNTLFLVKDVEVDEINYYFSSLNKDGKGALLVVDKITTAYKANKDLDPLAFEKAVRLRCSEFISALKKSD